ncbi:bacteriohopanetetrol glucosamine biosynthesis glycosyltransferase HpnI [Asaia siamensis]|uniref:Glucosyltransferase n=1 Tax=Asaia siamensis TaxID=110479 RepID=A0ABQ1LIY7_9PROT|nr:bacteriohopanetetrol glucosamine biosynthesis glycosyltransferase HpnI [Asaia siamensis]GBR04767.1 ceramide glucosyltransferase [Asaia siamensis NRIC 0323]GGC25158.1 glucosyltransferase [Asaia siamensis]
MALALNWLGYASAALAVAGCAQSAIGAGLIIAFRGSEKRRIARIPSSPGPQPAVTVLKPLHGDEPLLEDALRSFCEQDYPIYQIVFGVQRHDDSAIEIVRRLIADYPERDMTLVIDDTQHGTNRKIANLINMYPSVKHDILVISDSDIHVQRDYLRDVVSTIQQPDTGLVTTLYAGLPASTALVREFAASQINHNFMPGVMMSRLLGRQDCLGATMALRRSLLERVGGLAALADHVADDAILGQLVRAHGKKIALAPCMTWTTVAEDTAGDMIAHELRWGRTVKNVEPVGYGLSAIQLPLFWSSVVLFCCWPARWALWFFIAAWAVRGLSALVIDRSLGRLTPAVYALFPLREWLSAAIMVGSARGQRVAWRGQTLHIRRAAPITPPIQPVEPGD